MKLKSALILSLLISSAWAARKEVERFTLQEDRYELLHFLRPIGHDFFFDAGALVTGDAQGFIDDVETTADSGNTTTIQSFIDRNLNREHQAFVRAGLGFPLPSFDLFDGEWKPSFRAFSDLGASLSIGDPSNFEIIPGLSVTDALVQAYGKLDVRAGLFFDTRWSDVLKTQVYLYWNQRRDLFTQATASTLAADSKALNPLDQPDNSNRVIMTDLHVTYTYKKFNFTAGLEELKISELDDHPSYAQGLSFSTSKPLMRLHGTYSMETSWFDMDLMSGVYQRSFYDIDETFYIGAHLNKGAFVNGLVILDSGHLTLAPRIDIWKFHLEGIIKASIDGDVDGFNSDSLYGLNFRSSF